MGIDALAKQDIWSENMRTRRLSGRGELRRPFGVDI